MEKEEGRQPLPAEVERRLIDALELVRACDPAVGSGAFLLGVMQEIVLVRRGMAHAKREYIEGEEALITECWSSTRSLVLVTLSRSPPSPGGDLWSRSLARR